jgi:hypothetical protein
LGFYNLATVLATFSKALFIVLIFCIQTQLDATINLGFNNLATVLATFSKIGQFFFKLLVNLIKRDIFYSATSLAAPVIASATFLASGVTAEPRRVSAL